ncbi:unnamed protein product [Effrenium voratum]|nr:unnamed protein product [Effrenium voratum]
MGRCARLAGLCVQNASAECHYFQQCHAHCFAVALGSSAPGRCGPGAAPAQPLQLERRAARTFCRAELWGSGAAALGAAARWRRKLRLLARMGQEAAVPSVMSLTEVSRWHWALRLLNGMLRRRVRLDGQALAAGAAACEKAGAWRPALHLAQSCAALGGATSCALGAACAASGRSFVGSKGAKQNWAKFQMGFGSGFKERTGFLGKAAVALLRGCDRVLAGEEARFREARGSCGRAAAGPGARRQTWAAR